MCPHTHSGAGPSFTYAMISQNTNMIILTSTYFEHVANDCFFFCTEISLFILEKESYGLVICLFFEKREKESLIVHHNSRHVNHSRCAMHY